MGCAMKIGKGVSVIVNQEKILYCFIYLLFSFSNSFLSLDVYKLYMACGMCARLMFNVNYIM